MGRDAREVLIEDSCVIVVKSSHFSVRVLHGGKGSLAEPGSFNQKRAVQSGRRQEALLAVGREQGNHISYIGVT